MKEKKTVVIIGRFMFPKGQAASIRVIGVGKILREAGYSVIFIGKCLNQNSKDCLEGVYNGFQYYNLKNGLSIIERIEQSLLSGSRTIKLMEKKAINPDIIIYYGTSSSYLIPLLKYRKRKKISLITDIVEWYDATHVSGGKYGPLALDVNYTIKKLIPKCDGVIAISSFLENYYDALGVKTIRIPQLIDTSSEKWQIPNENSFSSKHLNLVYAGVPGKKDLIDVVIGAVKEVKTEGTAIKLHLFGPKKHQIMSVLGDNKNLVDDLSEEIVFHGIIKSAEIPRNLAKADFSVLIRPDKRYANAGFPTKFVESLAAGVPVIANLTSDLGLYLRDEETGLVVKGSSIEELSNALKRAAKLTDSQKRVMKDVARLEAQNSFDYRLYVDNTKKFLNRIIKSN